jgi:hypothetical protein
MLPSVAERTQRQVSDVVRESLSFVHRCLGLGDALDGWGDDSWIDTLAAEAVEEFDMWLSAGVVMADATYPIGAAS